MDVFWYDNLNVIFRDLSEFFPTKSQSLERRLNAILRLGIYTSLVLSIYNSSTKYLLIPLVIGILTLVLYTSEIKNKETYSNETCTMPTVSNPCMNFTMADFLNVDSEGTIKDKPEACKNVDEDISKAFEKNLYRDAGDMLVDGIPRAFYTLPSTTLTNDRETFMNWLYRPKNHCKEDLSKCLYSNLKYQPQIFPNALENPSK